jgi:hypothetical protein
VEATDLTALIKPASDQQYCFSVAWSSDVAPRTVAVEFGGHGFQGCGALLHLPSCYRWLFAVRMNLRETVRGGLDNQT